MGVEHAHALYVHGHSAIHRFPPEVKLAASFGFVLAVAVTPREAIWAFSAYAVVLVGLFAIAGISAGFVFARMAAILPFILFAFLIPFIATGERIEVFGISMSADGLWSAWGIVVKATLGIAVSILLAGTTEVPELLRGLGRLHMPASLTAIAGFMVRYLSLIGNELGRMRTAMTARAYDPRWLWQARPIATSAGALFIRSYERGERVHQAMLARGYTGTMPDLDDRRATRREWAIGIGLVLLTLTIASIAMVTS